MNHISFATKFVLSDSFMFVGLLLITCLPDEVRCSIREFCYRKILEQLNKLQVFVQSSVEIFRDSITRESFKVFAKYDSSE